MKHSAKTFAELKTIGRHSNAAITALTRRQDAIRDSRKGHTHQPTIARPH
jgi:hypothetical protein